MSVEDARVNQIEWSVADIKQAVKLLTQLALKADERMDALAKAQANSEARIAELAAAQIRTEEALLRLSTAVEALGRSSGD
jgi:DNA-binding FadR family transcriptional regulator